MNVAAPFIPPYGCLRLLLVHYSEDRGFLETLDRLREARDAGTLTPAQIERAAEKHFPGGESIGSMVLADTLQMPANRKRIKALWGKDDYLLGPNEDGVRAWKRGTWERHGSRNYWGSQVTVAPEHGQWLYLRMKHRGKSWQWLANEVGEGVETVEKAVRRLAEKLGIDVRKRSGSPEAPA